MALSKVFGSVLRRGILYSCSPFSIKVQQGRTFHVALKSMSSYHGPRKVPYVEPSINELPVPEGDWDKYDSQIQRKRNLQLVLGLSFYLFTMYVVFYSGIIEFNASIPRLLDIEPEPTICYPKPAPKKC